MQENKKKFKAPPKRFQPRGLNIIYEDHDILVADKASGLLTVSSEKVRENTAYYLLTGYVRKGNSKSRNRIFIVHRLDRDTSGVIVFAKNEYAQNYLQENWEGFTKRYIAVIHGTLPEKEGIITSYLTESSVYKMYSVDDPKNGKLSKTGYKVIKETQKFSLLEIDLITGRKNQIRVHFSEAGHPVAGDKKYGEGEKGPKRLALHSASITLKHPHTKEEMTFKAKVPPYINSLIKGS